MILNIPASLEPIYSELFETIVDNVNAFEVWFDNEVNKYEDFVGVSTKATKNTNIDTGLSYLDDIEVLVNNNINSINNKIVEVNDTLNNMIDRLYNIRYELLVGTLAFNPITEKTKRDTLINNWTAMTKVNIR